MNLLTSPRLPMPRPLPVPASRFRASAIERPSALHHWGLAGVVLGSLLALLAGAPAAWLAAAIDRASDGRLQLAQADGSWWRGSALLVLTGGPGSRSAAVLPARLHWQLRPVWPGLQLVLTQEGCIDGRLSLRWQAGWREQHLTLSGDGERLGHWPASWLEGLGAPLNTLRPSGEMVLLSPGLGAHRVDGQWRFDGQARLEVQQFSSRLSSVEPLGSYALALQPQPDGPLRMQLSTLDGALQLQGDGRLDGRGLHFHGSAQAAPGAEAALNNLLNVLGRREGALSRLAIG